MADQSSRLSDAELARFRRMLLVRMSTISGDLIDLEQETAEDEGGADRVPQDIADFGSRVQREDVLRTLANNERREVLEILDALERIDNGSYGICERTGEPIPKKRLEAIPWTRFTAEAARAIEEEEESAGR